MVSDGQRPTGVFHAWCWVLRRNVLRSFFLSSRVAGFVSSLCTLFLFIFRWTDTTFRRGINAYPSAASDADMENTVLIELLQITATFHGTTQDWNWTRFAAVTVASWLHKVVPKAPLGSEVSVYVNRLGEIFAQLLASTPTLFVLCYFGTHHLLSLPLLRGPPGRCRSFCILVDDGHQHGGVSSCAFARR